MGSNSKLGFIFYLFNLLQDNVGDRNSHHL